jgi:hypothetical protein
MAGNWGRVADSVELAIPKFVNKLLRIELIVRHLNQIKLEPEQHSAAPLKPAEN